MKQRVKSRVITGVLAGIAALSGSYAVVGNTPGFIGAPVSSVVVDNTPSQIVTFAIVFLGDWGHRIGFVFALALTVVLMGLIALLGSEIGRRVYGGLAGSVLLTIAFVGVTSLLLSRSVLSLFGASIPAAIVVGYSELNEYVDVEPIHKSRRRFVRTALGVFGFGILSYLFGSLRVGNEPSVDDSFLPKEEIQGLLDRASEKSLDIEGIPGLVSDIDEFYEVDINSVNPSVNPDSLRLRITGEVEEELTFTYDDITSLPQENRYMTLRCVGERLNGEKMDNAVWTGVPIMDIIEEANPQGNYVMLRAADGYYEEFSVEALRTGFLAYGMNGEALPRGHGHPVRALIPGHWGEINVKWLTEIEILEEEEIGYWEERGWHGTGPVNTVAKIWAVNRLEGGRFQVGGHAYAGTRGIEKVEVSVDGGETWNEAELSEPLEGEDVWRQWKYEWTPSKGEHTIIARATDGEGNLQPKKESQPFPSGPTGWVSKTIDI